jgi:hypothetical protein
MQQQEQQQQQQQQQQSQQHYAEYRTLPSQYGYGPSNNGGGGGYSDHPSFEPLPPSIGPLLLQQHQQQQQPALAMSYGPPAASVAYQSTYTPHLQQLQQLDHSPSSYMAVDEPISAGGHGQRSPTQPTATAATSADTRKSSSSTNRTSFSNDVGTAAKRPSPPGGRKASLSAAAGKMTLDLEEDEGDGKKKRKRVERACCASWGRQPSCTFSSGRRKTDLVTFPGPRQSLAGKSGPSATASSPVRSASTTSSTASTRRRHAR